MKKKIRRSSCDENFVDEIPDRDAQIEMPKSRCPDRDAQIEMPRSRSPDRNAQIEMPRPRKFRKNGYLPHVRKDFG